MTHAPSSSAPDGYLAVGTLGKPHGLAGEIVAALTSDRAERTVAGAEFHTTAGTLVIEKARRHQEKWLFCFAGIKSREAAAEIRGLTLFAEPIDDPETLWVHELIGTTVVDQAGTERGEVTEVQANPASDLLVLDSGALVPLTFVVGSIDDGVVHVDVPDGLFELND